MERSVLCVSLLLSGAWRRKALEPHCVNHHPHFRVGGLLRFGGSAGCVSFPSLSFPSLSFPSLSPLCGACACWGLRGLAWPSLFCCTRGSAASPLSLSSPLSLPPPPCSPLSLVWGPLLSQLTRPFADTQHLCGFFRTRCAERLCFVLYLRAPFLGTSSPVWSKRPAHGDDRLSGRYPRSCCF